MDDVKPNSTTVSKMRFTELFRRDVAETLGFSHKRVDAGQRMRFLKNIDWDYAPTRDEVAKLYINRVAMLAYNDIYTQGRRLTLSWGSPETDSFDHPETVENEKLLRPQLRTMVQNAYSEEERETNPDLPPEHYIITYTPPFNERQPSAETLAFIEKLRDTIQNDLEIELPAPMPHDTHATLEIDTGDKAGNAAKPHFFTRNMYAEEGVSMDLILPADAAIKGFMSVISQGQRELSSAHIGHWELSPDTSPLTR